MALWSLGLLQTVMELAEEWAHSVLRRSLPPHLSPRAVLNPDMYGEGGGSSLRE